MKHLTFAALALCVAGCASMGGKSQISVLSAGAVEPGLAKVVEQFQRDTGHAVKVEYGTAPQLAKRLAAGEKADVLIVPPSALDEEIKAGNVFAQSRTSVGRVGIGVVVRAGAPVPDVASVDALKRALLAADSVVYNQASSGLYLEKLFDKIGIGAQIKAKTTRYANGAQVLEHLINGKGNEIGFGAITEIRMFEPKGLKLVGPLPAEVQNYTSYAAGVMTAAPTPDVARDFVRYLGTPAARALFSAAGIE
jgi:molybdate transport system substrate-binding protein